MQKLTKSLLTLLLAMGFAHVSNAATATYGDDNGLGLGLSALDTDVVSTSNVGSGSSFSSSSLTTYTGLGVVTDTWVYGKRTFRMFLPTVGENVTIDSLVLEIAVGGATLTDTAPKLFMEQVVNGSSSFAQVGSLSSANGVTSGGVTHNALLLDRFDLTSYLDNIFNGTFFLVVEPGGGNQDGWTLDFARLVVNGTGSGSSDVTAPVPVPAAVWFMMTGIATLVGFRKKKTV